jgi:hypothetical protein
MESCIDQLSGFESRVIVLGVSRFDGRLINGRAQLAAEARVMPADKREQSAP